MHPSSFCNYNHENHSKSSQIHHHLHYNPFEDQPIVRQLSQQQPPFSNGHNYHTTTINVAHEKSTLNTTNGKFVAVDHDINRLKSSTVNRSSKKDRHSKINTARGPRDRRMRLSLDVAKKFFKLQDMLGFDKASNTIEWLLMKSKSAIRDLFPQQSNSSSSPSECEVLSGSIDDQFTDKIGDQDEVIIIDKEKFNSCNNNIKEKKKIDRVRKSLYIDHSLAKETREKARARARKRTTEKKNIKIGCDRVSDQYTNRLGSWIPFGENQVQTSDHQAEYPSSNFQFKQGIIGDNSSMMSNNWSPLWFNYQHNPGPSHEHQFNDFQILGKPWEGINN